MILLTSIHRASAALSSRCERVVLTKTGLSWSAFVTLWCLWIFGELEIRVLAVEAGIAKSTLSNVLNRLEAKKLVARRARDGMRRLMLVGLAEGGEKLMSHLFPYFNAEETRIVGMLSASQVRHTTDVLRSVVSATADLAPPAGINPD